MIYLDNAATTWPKPKSVKNAMMQALDKYGANPGRSGYNMSIDTSEQVFQCRENLAEMFHAESLEQVCFTMNCTYALNIALKGLLKYGDHVITSEFEHNAVARPLSALKDFGIIDFDIAKIYEDDNRTIRSFESLIRNNTKAIVCTHVSNVFGVTLPIEKIGRLAKRYGIMFIVDAAQSAGIINIDIQKMNIDCLCMPGHKGLYGPMGTGILIVKNGESLSTIIEGGTGSVSESMIQPDFLPDRFESGTINVPSIIALNAGVNFVKNLGINKIYSHEMKLITRLYRGLRAIKGVNICSPEPVSGKTAPVLAFNIENMFSAEAGDLIGKRGIAVRSGYHCAPFAHKAMGTMETGAIRACPSAFTTQNDIDGLIKCVKDIS